MSINSKSDLFSAVSLFNGTNFKLWKTKMTDYLSYLGLWGYVVDTLDDAADLYPDIDNYTTKTTVDSTTTTVVDNLCHSTNTRQWNKGNTQALASV